MSATHTLTYSRTHTSIFVADNIRNVLRDIIREGDLDPTKLMDEWSAIGVAIKTWLDSGHLEKIVIEFYVPGSAKASARWDFPISYDGAGVDDDMWVSNEHIISTIAKASKPPGNAVYRVLLVSAVGRPDVAGMGNAQFKSTEGMICRSAGTSIATPDIMAGLQYWRAA